MIYSKKQRKAALALICVINDAIDDILFSSVSKAFHVEFSKIPSLPFEANDLKLLEADILKHKAIEPQQKLLSIEELVKIQGIKTTVAQGLNNKFEMNLYEIEKSKEFKRFHKLFSKECILPLTLDGLVLLEKEVTNILHGDRDAILYFIRRNDENHEISQASKTQMIN